MRGRAFAVARLFAVACLFCGAAAQADSFPSGKIRIVVPTAAAGVADSLARIVMSVRKSRYPHLRTATRS